MTSAWSQITKIMNRHFEGRPFSPGLFYAVMKLSFFATWARESSYDICHPDGNSGKVPGFHWIGFFFRNDLNRGFIYNTPGNQKNHIIPN
jgi:hypothetical protein